LRFLVLAAVFLAAMAGPAEAQLTIQIGPNTTVDLSKPSLTLGDKVTLKKGAVVCTSYAGRRNYESSMTERQMSQLGCLKLSRATLVRGNFDHIDNLYKVRVLDIDDLLYLWVNASDPDLY